MTKPSDSITDVEWEILKVVWAEQPCTAGTVQEALESTRSWAYSTVKTTMDRMRVKGLLKMKRLRNLQLFSATLTEKKARRGELKRTLARAFDGATSPALHMLLENKDLTREDIEELKTWLKEAERHVRD